jgi:uncharacterized protein
MEKTEKELPMATTLNCPKCQGDMRNYERNGIHVDQCTECRGVFLDRGELEHLMAAEAAYSAPPPPQQAQPQQAPPQQDYRQQDYRQQDYRKPQYQQKPYKKKSLLSELFD